MLQLKLNQAMKVQFEKALREAPEKARRAIAIGLRRCGDQLRNDAIDLAPHRTGYLQGSITIDPPVPTTKVEVGSNVEYARIHDQGGVIPEHDIYPKKGKALAFMWGGKMSFFKKVHQKERTVKPYKGRGYLTPAFKRIKEGGAEKIFTQELQRIFQK